jgi:hypothetical protein
VNRFFHFLSLLAIVLLSCNFGTGLVRGPALVEATGPILGMTVAASIDDQGEPVDPSFTYPFDQPEIVVFVRIGEIDAGPMTFSWYRITEEGDESLFEQTVAVEAWDAAFSTGSNTGILATGTYRVIATLAGQSETIVWDVAAPQPGDLTAPVGTSQSAEGGPPIPGPSGTTIVAVSEPMAQNLSGPQASPLIWPDDKIPQVSVEVNPDWFDPQTGDWLVFFPMSFTIQVSAAITGLSPGPSRQFRQAAGPAQHSLHYLLDPCSLPGGTDLPGTSITVTAFPLGYETNVETDTRTLGADTSLPILDVKKSVQPGQRVNPGEEIAFTVTAEELTSEGSWQTGISLMQLTGPGDTPEPWSNPDPEPQACGSKTRIHTETFTYTVPASPLAEFELCVIVQDFAGNPAKNCGTYYTSSQLKGKLSSTVTTSLLGGQNIGTDVAQGIADLTLILKPDGTLTGTAVYDYAQRGEGAHSCGSYSESTTPLQVTLPVSGEWTKDTIDFRFTSDTRISVETRTTCAGETLAAQHDVTNMIVGRDWHANWDGQAYAAADRITNSGPDWTSQSDWTIHLEPPGPVSD